MRKFGLGFALLALACGAGSGALAQVRDHDPPAEFRYPRFTGAVPLCGDALVLSELSYSFAGREAEFWNSGLAIEGYYPPEEIGYRTNGLSYIPRRYCRTTALFNDGVLRKVVYNVAEAQGFIGIGPGVTWCVEGLDRNHAFSPNCRAAGP
jgi:hypothetical protein